MTSTTPPGWYHAEGDPPGTQRYWDGEAWQGAPQTVPTAPFASSSSGGAYAERSGALTALLISIGGLFCCGLLFPVGWKLGKDEVDAIDAGTRDPTNRSTANAARVIGMIGTFLVVALFGLGLLLTVAGTVR